jgi:hypothetical protein
MIACGIRWPSQQAASQTLADRIAESLADALLERAGVVLKGAA